jgi:hypothetical protein
MDVARANGYQIALGCCCFPFPFLSFPFLLFLSFFVVATWDVRSSIIAEMVRNEQIERKSDAGNTLSGAYHLKRDSLVGNFINGKT